MRIRIPLSAGVPARQWFKASSVVIASTGAAASVNFTLFGGDQQDAESFGDCERLFGIYDPTRIFSGVELTAPVDCVVELLVSRSRIEVMDGATVTATLSAEQLPLSVTPTRGDAPANPFYVTGLTYTDTPAASNANANAVAVAGAVVLVAAASAGVLERRFTNIGTDPAALGAAGLTWAQRAVVLNPGDTWVESKGAALAWYGITAGGAASITVQELHA